MISGLIILIGANMAFRRGFNMMMLATVMLKNAKPTIQPVVPDVYGLLFAGVIGKFVRDTCRLPTPSKMV